MSVETLSSGQQQSRQSSKRSQQTVSGNEERGVVAMDLSDETFQMLERMKLKAKKSKTNTKKEETKKKVAPNPQNEARVRQIKRTQVVLNEKVTDIVASVDKLSYHKKKDCTQETLFLYDKIKTVLVKLSRTDDEAGKILERLEKKVLRLNKNVDGLKKFLDEMFREFAETLCKRHVVEAMGSLDHTLLTSINHIMTALIEAYPAIADAMQRSRPKNIDVVSTNCSIMNHYLETHPNVMPTMCQEMKRFDDSNQLGGSNEKRLKIDTSPRVLQITPDIASEMIKPLRKNSDKLFRYLIETKNPAWILFYIYQGGYHILDIQRELKCDWTIKNITNMLKRMQKKKKVNEEFPIMKGPIELLFSHLEFASDDDLMLKMESQMSQFQGLTLEQQFQQFMLLMQTCIKNMIPPIEHDIIVYRGFGALPSNDDDTMFAQDARRLRVGQRISSSSFVSTSYDPGVAGDDENQFANAGCCVYKIIVPAGYQCILLSQKIGEERRLGENQFALQAHYQGEVLLPAGTIFEVIEQLGDQIFANEDRHIEREIDELPRIHTVLLRVVGYSDIKI